MEKEQLNIDLLPINNEQKELITKLLGNMNKDQVTWLSGYVTGILSGLGSLTTSTGLNQPESPQGDGATDIDSGTPVIDPQAEKPSQSIELTILYGSKSGNSVSVAKYAKNRAEELGFNTKCVNMADYKPRDLKKEKNLLIVISTDGEGVPPFAAEELYEFLHSKKVSKLDHLNYAVCALGDSSYVHFCKTGIDFDKKISALGGSKIIDRIDCDLDFEEPSSGWVEQVLNELIDKNKENNQVLITGGNQSSVQEVKTTQKYGKKNPFSAQVIDKIKLNGRGSKKETYHFEFSLEGSGLTYKPGDSIGIIPVNSKRSVDELISHLKLDPTSRVKFENDEILLKQALRNHYEITTLTKKVIDNYNKFANSTELSDITSNPEKLKEFVYGRDILDLLKTYPVPLRSDDLIGILRKMQPRLYSLASSHACYPDEAHILVASVRYKTNDRYKEGACSAYLIDNIEVDQEVMLYVDRNELFRIPEDGNRPMIMIGPGTGIAPFRAFLQERELLEHTGKNWLFFGDWNFTTDFLYQTEWQKFHKSGLLNEIDVAFSRDQKDKVYVQHKMKKKSKELFAWIEEGANIYVCGDVNRMAPDVNRAFTEIIQKEGNMNIQKAKEYMINLKKQNRYVEDVY